MNIFVARLDFGIETEELIERFQEFGEVDTENSKIIFDRETGRSKGFGFIEMPNEDEALEAIKNLNGVAINEREIVVKVSEPKSKDNRRSGGYNNRGGGYGGGYGNNRGGGGYGGGDYGGGYSNNRY